MENYKTNEVKEGCLYLITSGKLKGLVLLEVSAPWTDDKLYLGDTLLGSYNCANGDYFNSRLALKLMRNHDTLSSDNIMNNLNFYNEQTAETYPDSMRVCSVCGSAMFEGYCYEGGEAYYCNTKCMRTQMLQEEWDELYDNGNGDSYWTEWE